MASSFLFSYTLRQYPRQVRNTKLHLSTWSSGGNGSYPWPIYLKSFEMEQETPEPTKSKAGRKQSGTEPLTRRAQLNRENQRKFRQRKEQYVANLERQNAEFNEIVATKNAEAAGLQASVSSLQDEIVSLKRLVSQLEVANRVILNQPTPPNLTERNSCRMCSLERANAVFSDGQVKVLSLKLAAAEAEIQNLKEIGNSMRNQPYMLPSGFDFLFAASSNNNNSLSTLEKGELGPRTNPIRMDDSQHALLSSSSGGLDPSITLTNHGFPTSTGSALKTPNSESIILTTSPNGSNGDDWMDEFMMTSDTLPPVAFVKQRVASAESLYGPMRVEFARYSMKCIPALKNSILVDEWVEASIMADCIALFSVANASHHSIKNEKVFDTRSGIMAESFA
ncbi:hypothetical protein BJ741DRAFT_167787 [Chytriomyces cf. hyalinus JEL632]|nr:hypothetical protein BJ741DRAFT_167787 [Chytriomyces cf. hyalinus JEL632]